MNIQTQIKILTTQIDRLYADNEFCQHEEEITTLEKHRQNLKTRLEQKPATKNSVVCSIAAKLAKHGVKNPMSIAWKLYRIAMNCLNAVAKKCYFDFYAFAYQLECILVQHRLSNISQVLPASVCNVLKKHALSLSI